ncbi:MAG: hypothetical protein RIC14_06585 [Filomicrobium sp.]
MYEQLTTIQQRPQLFSAYTAETLWTQPLLANQMLQMHLDQDSVLASRPVDAIDRVVDWIDQSLGLDGASVCDLGRGPGLYASKFAERSLTVLGVDFSLWMLY